MSYDPMTHLSIARARHEDFVQEAERRDLAAAVQGENSSLRNRVAALLGRRPSRRAAQHVAPAAK